MNKKMLSLLLFVSLTFFCNVTLNAQVEHCGIVEYHESAKHLHLIEKTIKPQIPSSCNYSPIGHDKFSSPK